MSVGGGAGYNKYQSQIYKIVFVFLLVDPEFLAEGGASPVGGYTNPQLIL